MARLTQWMKQHPVRTSLCLLLLALLLLQIIPLPRKTTYFDIYTGQKRITVGYGETWITTEHFESTAFSRQMAHTGLTTPAPTWRKIGIESLLGYTCLYNMHYVTQHDLGSTIEFNGMHASLETRRAFFQAYLDHMDDYSWMRAQIDSDSMKLILLVHDKPIAEMPLTEPTREDLEKLRNSY